MARYIVWVAAAITYDMEERLSILQGRKKEEENWREQILKLLIQASTEILEILSNSVHRGEAERLSPS